MTFMIITDFIQIESWLELNSKGFAKKKDLGCRFVLWIVLIQHNFFVKSSCTQTAHLCLLVCLLPIILV